MECQDRVEMSSFEIDYVHDEIQDKETTGSRITEGIENTSNWSHAIGNIRDGGTEDAKENTGNGISHRYMFKPETYNGQGNWEEYITNFELCVEIGNWSEKDKPIILGTSLKDQARTYYTGLTITEKRNYTILIQKLGHRFGRTGKSHITRWRQEFENRIRNTGESIAALADDLHRLSRKAYEDLDTKAQITLALHQLYKSVKSEVKLRCMDKDCTSLDEAVMAIETYEQIMEEDPASGNENRSSTLRMDRLELAVDKLTENFQMCLKHFAKERGQTDMISKERIKTCYVCNSTKHFRKDCPHRK